MTKVKRVKTRKNKEESIPQKNPVGRPEVPVDMDQVRALCRMKPTLADAAAFFKCSEDTIERRIKEHFHMTFKELVAQEFVQTKYDLIRHGISRAKKSDPMFKYIMGNLANWRERQDVTSAGKQIENPSNATVVLFKIPENGSEKK